MISFEDFKKVDIRTAKKVLEAQDHPQADKTLPLKE